MMLTDTDLLAGVDHVTDVTITMWRNLKSNVNVCLAPEKQSTLPDMSVSLMVKDRRRI